MPWPLIFSKNVNKANKTVTFFDSKHFIVDVFGEEENFYYKYDSLYMLLQGFYKKLHINCNDMLSKSLIKQFRKINYFNNL